MDVDPEMASLAALGVVTGLWIAATYEVYAVKTGKVRPITYLINALPWPAKIISIVLPMLAWFDHFVTHYFL